MLDMEIQSGVIARHIRFRKDKMHDLPRITRALEYVCGKLKERYKDVIASPFTIAFYEYDADNFVKNLITARIKFDYIIATQE